MITKNKHKLYSQITINDQTNFPDVKYDHYIIVASFEGVIKFTSLDNK